MAEDLEKLKGDKKIPFRVMMKRTSKYVKSEWLALLISGLLIIANVAFDIVLPLFIKHLTDNLQTPADDTLKIVIFIAVGFLVLSIVSQGLAYIEAMVLQKAGQRIVYKLRIEVF